MKPLIIISLALLSFFLISAAEEQAANYLVFVNYEPSGVPCKTYHLNILKAALGSEEKAKAVILYNYKNVVSGFSVRVTPSQLDAIKKQPQVNRVLPDKKLQLM